MRRCRHLFAGDGALVGKQVFRAFHNYSQIFLLVDFFTLPKYSVYRRLMGEEKSGRRGEKKSESRSRGTDERGRRRTGDTHTHTKKEQVDCRTARRGGKKRVRMQIKTDGPKVVIERKFAGNTANRERKGMRSARCGRGARSIAM